MLLIKIRFLSYVRSAILVIKKLIVDNLVIFLLFFKSLSKFSYFFAIFARNANFLIVCKIDKLFFKISKINFKNFLHIQVVQCYVNKYVVNLNIIFSVQ